VNRRPLNPTWLLLVLPLGYAVVWQLIGLIPVNAGAGWDGAVYLDAGFDAARDLVLRLFEPLVAESTMEVWRKDAKTTLQEWLQARKMAVPTYRIEATRGKAHAQTFVVACDLPELSLSMQAEGLSRRAAEQAAAELMMAHLHSLPNKAVSSGKPTPKVVVKKSRKPQQG